MNGLPEIIFKFIEIFLATFCVTWSEYESRGMAVKSNVVVRMITT